MFNFQTILPDYVNLLLPHWGSYVFVKKKKFEILVSEYSEQSKTSRNVIFSIPYIYLLYAYILNIILQLFLLKLWYINFYLWSKQNIPSIELKIFLLMGCPAEFPWARELANVFDPTSSLSSNLTIFL